MTEHHDVDTHTKEKEEIELVCASWITPVDKDDNHPSSEALIFLPEKEDPCEVAVNRTSPSHTAPSAISSMARTRAPHWSSCLPHVSSNRSDSHPLGK